MALQIVVTTRADKKFDKLLDYINTEFGFNSASQLAIKFYDVLDLIAEYPNIGTIEKKEKAIKGFLLTKHTRIFYRVEKNKLIIINLFDTRQSPTKKLK